MKNINNGKNTKRANNSKNNKNTKNTQKIKNVDNSVDSKNINDSTDIKKVSIFKDIKSINNTTDINYIKDTLYEVSDIILASIVFIIIVITIGWQLYGWFDVDKQGTLSEKSEVVENMEQVSAKNEEQKSNDENTANNAPDTMVDFEIKPGDSGAVIAYNLKKLHLIPTQREFLATLKNLNLEGKLKAGTHKLKTSFTMEEIAQTLAK